MTLDPSLDKLRNKELRFWTYICSEWFILVIANVEFPRLIEGDNTPYYRTIYSDKLLTAEQFTVIWMPLTRWRIRCVLLKYQNRQILIKSLGARKCLSEVWDILDELGILFDCNYELYDQNELQRMKNEKRPELKTLLIQFSNYL